MNNSLIDSLIDLIKRTYTIKTQKPQDVVTCVKIVLKYH